MITCYTVPEIWCMTDIIIFHFWAIFCPFTCSPSSPFYLLHLIDQGNVKLGKSISLFISSRYNHINISSTNSNMSYSDITRQKVQSNISFSLNEHDFPPLSNVCQPILSNVSESRINVNLLLM